MRFIIVIRPRAHPGFRGRVQGVVSFKRVEPSLKVSPITLGMGSAIRDLPQIYYPFRANVCIDLGFA